MMTQTLDIRLIRADQLMEGDIIQDMGGENWMVITQPEYISFGISFDVLRLDVDAKINTQTVSFAVEDSFILLSRQHCLN